MMMSNLRKPGKRHLSHREKWVPKRYRWGTIATNSTLLFKGALFFFLNNHVHETVPLGQWGTEIVPLRVPYYGQSNSAPRGTISVPFFLSDGSDMIPWACAFPKDI